MYIDSIIGMVEGRKYKTVYQEEKFQQYSDIYNEACDDIIEQLRKMDEWLPISEAPKDGTHFLGYRPTNHLGGETMREMYWKSDVGCFGGNGWHYPEWAQPTHFRPLLKPPINQLEG